MGYGNAANLPETTEDKDCLIIDLEKILALEETQTEGMTTAEIADALNIPQRKAVSLVRDAVKSGKMVSGRRTIHRDWDGRARHYTVFCAVKG